MHINCYRYLRTKCSSFKSIFFFFFNDTATTEIYTLSLHDALPISGGIHRHTSGVPASSRCCDAIRGGRSEEHTSELQSHSDLVCRLLLEKKKRKKHEISIAINDAENYDCGN